MAVADRVRDNLLATFGVFVFSTALAAVCAVGATVWFVLAVLGDGPLVGALETILPLFAVGLVLGVPLALAAFVGVSYGLVVHTAARVGAKVDEMASDCVRWTGRIVRDVERESDLARFVDLSPVVEAVDQRSPETRAQDRIDQLTGRYVDGSLSETELERRVSGVLAEEDVGKEDSTTLDLRLAEARRESE